MPGSAHPLTPGSASKDTGWSLGCIALLGWSDWIRIDGFHRGSALTPFDCSAGLSIAFGVADSGHWSVVCTTFLKINGSIILTPILLKLLIHI